MNAVRSLLPGLVMAVASAVVQAQFVKGNEAVTVLPDGSKKVETPPLPHSGKAGNLSPCAAAAGCNAGPWNMVETADGLRECTEPYARPSTCRNSTYGGKKLSRLWIVKKGPTWLWCEYPDLSKTCVNMNARPPLNLPISAVQ